MMDYYLSSKSDDLDIPPSALDKYELMRSRDNITRAVNHLIKGQSQDAKKLLRKSFSIKVYPAMVGYIGKPRFLAYWIGFLVQCFWFLFICKGLYRLRCR